MIPTMFHRLQHRSIETLQKVGHLGMVGRGVHRQGRMEIRDKEIQVSQAVIKEIRDKLYRHNHNKL